MNRLLSRSHFLAILAGAPAAGHTGTHEPDSQRPRTALQPYTGPWDSDRLLHLLRRCLFGVTPADLKRFAGLDLDACLDILLTPSSPVAPPVNAYNDAHYTDPDVPFGQTWVHASFGDPDGPQEGKRVDSLKAWWVGCMIHQDHSLTEKMTLFWSNHLAAQMYQMKDSRLDYGYLALLRAGCLGNFKKLVRDMTTNPGMLEYLNTNVNTAKAPNENYARELQELFTVGKGPDSHYTEADVREAARVLTGWETVDRPGGVFAVFNAPNHDIGDKKFSAFYGHAVIRGRTGAAGTTETDELIDMIFAQRAVAMYTCRNLYRWFVYHHIDAHTEAHIISPLADIFIAHGFELQPTLRALLSGEHFYDEYQTGCQIKNPAEHLIGAYRQFGVADPVDLPSRYASWSHLAWLMGQMGMNPGDPPNVAGWPATYQTPAYSRLWISSTTLTARNQATDTLASAHGIQSDAISLHFDVLRFTQQLSQPEDPDRLIAEAWRILCAPPVSTAQQHILRDILLSSQAAAHYWTAAWQDYCARPDDEVVRSVVTRRLIPFYTYILQRSEYQLA